MNRLLPRSLTTRLVVTAVAMTRTTSPSRRAATGTDPTRNCCAGTPTDRPRLSGPIVVACSAATESPITSARTESIFGDAWYVSWPGAGLTRRTRSQ